MNKISLANCFPHIYLQKFGTKLFIDTPLGFVFNKPSYLQLEDLDLINDLGHILDFYRDIDFEGNSLNIILPFTKVNERWNRKISCTCCNTRLKQPIYYYREIFNENKKHVTLICYECLTHVPHDKQYLKKYSLINFNISEWIPIGGFLENRNSESELYLRKMIYYKENDLFILRLIHRNCDYNLTKESTILVDTIWKVCDKLPEILTRKIIKMSTQLNYIYKCSKTFKTIITV